MRATPTIARGPVARATRRPPGRADSHKRWTDRRGPDTGTTNYGYDADGDTTSIANNTTPGSNQTLTWNDQGKLGTDTTTTGTTTYVYDTDGSLLLEAGPAATTLFAGDQQFTLNPATKKVTGLRFYSLGGQQVAVRSANTVQYLIGDQQSTTDLAIDSSTQHVTRRDYTPFGAPRAGSGTLATGQDGYVGGTADPTTTLENLGAREYSPTIGRFESVDPILETGSPQQLNGYCYAGNNPVTNADPTGLMLPGSDESEIIKESNTAPQPPSYLSTFIGSLTGKPAPPPPYIYGYFTGGQTGSRAGQHSRNFLRHIAHRATAEADGVLDKSADLVLEPLGIYDDKASEDAGCPYGRVHDCDLGESLFSYLVVAVSALVPELEEAADSALAATAAPLGDTSAAEGTAADAASAPSKSPSSADAGVADTADDLPDLSVGRSQLEAKFKHAADFGVADSRGTAGFDAYGKAVESFVNDSSTVRKAGTYRGNPAILNYNSTSRLAVIQRPDGSFVSGYKLSQAQLQNAINRGSLGGG